MNNDILEMIKDNCYLDDTITYGEIDNNLQEDYNELIDLRDRIANGTDNDMTIYEEDHLLLDNVLDYMEILITLIRKGDKNNV